MLMELRDARLAWRKHGRESGGGTSPGGPEGGEHAPWNRYLYTSLRFFLGISMAACKGESLRVGSRPTRLPGRS